MNLKDARVQKTRNNIHQVFFKLLKEKPISRITVSEICQQCQINRSTFYKHYADPYDLLEKTEESFLTHLEKEFENRWRNDFDLWMTDILTYMKENRDVYHALDSANGDSALSLKVFSLPLPTIIRSGGKYAFSIFHTRMQWCPQLLGTNRNERKHPGCDSHYEKGNEWNL